MFSCMSCKVSYISCTFSCMSWGGKLNRRRWKNITVICSLNSLLHFLNVVFSPQRAARLYHTQTLTVPAVRLLLMCCSAQTTTTTVVYPGEKDMKWYERLGKREKCTLAFVHPKGVLSGASPKPERSRKQSEAEKLNSSASASEKEDD